MNEYRFLTLWRIHAPLPEIWEAIRDAEHWPGWWPCVRNVHEIRHGDAAGVGAIRHFTWRGALPYSLSFDMRVTKIDPMRTIEGEATGEVEGIGRWHFETEGKVTVVRYEWHVHTRRAWMNRLTPIARPLFKWNHDYVMRRGGIGLADFLNAHLVEILDIDAPPAEFGEIRSGRTLRAAARARGSTHHHP